MLTALDEHFTIQEIAKAWKLDEDTIRKIFIDEAGVLRIGRTTSRGGKRSYVKLRVPGEVLNRVHRSRTGGQAA